MQIVARRLALVAVLTLFSCSSQPAFNRAAALKGASAPAQDPFPIPVIQLAGSGREMGLEHGRQLGPAIRELHDAYFKAYFQSEAGRFFALTAAGAFSNRLLPEHREEIRALAEQTGIDPRQMLLAQCFLDLTPMTACSTVALPAEAAPDGVARFGRNLDFLSFNVAEKQTVVMIFRPAASVAGAASDTGSTNSSGPDRPVASSRRYAFATVGWPGLVGALSGMNEHGLTLASMEISREGRLPSAMPYMLLYRMILEQCATVEEAAALLERTPRQTANNLMLMDGSGARAVAEITPQKVIFRRGLPGQALISTNHQRGQDSDAPGLCDRYDSLHELSRQNFGQIDVKAVEGMLAKASQPRFTLQSMVFEPANRVIYLSAGAEAAHQPFHRLDLKPYFAGRTRQTTVAAQAK